MKKLLSKKMFLFSGVALVISFVVYSCTKNQQAAGPEETLVKKTETPGGSNSLAASTGNPFVRTVGALIPAQTGNQWIANYLRANTTGQPPFYIMQRQWLQNILSNSSCTGICLYYAVRPGGQLCLLPIGIDESGTRIIPASIPLSTGAIAWPLAQQWIANYTGAVKAHFFGSNTFSRLFSNSACNIIKTSFALDDSNQPQLLLSNAQVASPDQYEDDSGPCPPFCPK